jgi:hypothetical protein
MYVRVCVCVCVCVYGFILLFVNVYWASEHASYHRSFLWNLEI